MAGTGYQSSDILRTFNQLTGRPATDPIDDPTKYTYLANAEQYILTRIAGISAKCLYGAPTQLTTADGGFTYTFGTDGNGYPLFPIGSAHVYNSLTAIPTYPLTPGRDYLDEGVTIRGMNGQTIPGPLYWYGLTPTQQMSASVQPILQPPPVRVLIAVKGAEDFANSAGVRNAVLADRMQQRFEVEFGQAMVMIRKHFRGGGAMGRLLAPWGVPAGVYAGSL